MSDFNFYVKLGLTLFFVTVMVCMCISIFFSDDDYKH